MKGEFTDKAVFAWAESHHLVADGDVIQGLLLSLPFLLTQRQGKMAE